jgi:hypothetical protein
MSRDRMHGALPPESFIGDLQGALDIIVLLLHPEERSEERLETAKGIVARLERQVDRTAFDERDELHAEMATARDELDAITELDDA